MTTSEKATMPTATAREHRLRLFQPTRRPAYTRELEIVTQYGHVLVTGRCGQAHADLLDALFYCAEKKGETPDERIKLLVDPARIRRTIGVGGEQLEKLARELAEAVVHIKEPVKLACIGHLVDHIDTACKADGTPITRFNPLTKGERALWRVELGKALCKLIAKDAWVGYDPAPIARLKHGISQAIARHVLSHKTPPPGGKWTLDGLIVAVAGKLGTQQMRDRRREVRADADALAVAGVQLNGDRVHRVGQTPGNVEQTPGSVEQTPGAWSKRPAQAGSLTGTPVRGACAHDGRCATQLNTPAAPTGRERGAYD